MFVKDFGQNLNSIDLNTQLQQVYNWSLNLNEMSNDHATHILDSMKNKINNIKSSHKRHVAEKNPQYMEALLVSNILETLIDERFHEDMMNRKKMKTERELSASEASRREKYVKGMKKVKGDFEKRYPGSGKAVMYATATKMAKKESVEEAMDILKSILNGVTQINESEYEQAKTVMAARDMVDSVQDMVEKLSAMVNEDLPALIDVMRSEVGQAQADMFANAVSSSVGPLIDQVKAARTSLDNAARTVAGEPIATPAVPTAPMAPAPEELPIEEPEASADVATGGNLELGRTKRV
jgi:hypothetical protein